MGFYKVIRTGNIIEIYEYQYVVNLTQAEELAERKESEKENILDRDEKRKLYDKQSSNRARQNIRRLITNNFKDGDTFLTLTFKENWEDVQTANYELKKFVQKMKRKQKDFKHVTVIEFQKRGAVHYHMICNYRHGVNIDNKEEREDHEQYLGKKVWKHGYVDMVDIRGVDNVGAYVIKYMTKGERDDRLFGQKSYFSGGDLERPQFITDDNEVYEIVELYKNLIPTFTSEYTTEFTGRVMYKEFNLERMGYIVE